MAVMALGLVPCAAAGATTGGGAGYGASATTASAPTLPTTTPPTTVPATGGQVFGAPDPSATPTVPGFVAKVLPDGTAAAPELAPPEVQQVIWAGNQIIGTSYVLGGGHRSFRVKSKGYDCSGAVSYALHGGDLLDRPRDSVAFMRWGSTGTGSWITVYTATRHAYLVVAGLRLDTSAAGDRTNAKGPRWRPLRRSNDGYKSRHPVGL
jgi:hypothetical protein